MRVTAQQTERGAPTGGLLAEARARVREAEAAEQEGLARLQALGDEQQKVENTLRALKAAPSPADATGIEDRLDQLEALSAEKRRLEDLHRGAVRLAEVTRDRATEARRAVEALEREAAWLRQAGIPEAERAALGRLAPVGELCQTVRMMRWHLPQDVAELQARRTRLAALEGRAQEPDGAAWSAIFKRFDALAADLETLQAEVEAAVKR